MAVEEKRGCGHRKAGGLYLMGGGVGEPCERLPIPLTPCPWCKRPVVSRTRGLQWVGVACAVAGAVPCMPEAAGDHLHGLCPICTTSLMAEAEPKDEFALLWIGKEHYATPRHWIEESNRLGVSRRLSAIPKRMVLGKTWVLVAHPEACEQSVKVKRGGDLAEVEEVRKVAGVFHAFRPRAIELVVTPSMRKQKWVKQLVKKHGVQLVEVPEDDPDHAPELAKKSARKRAMDRAARKLASRKPQDAKEATSWVS